MESAALVAFAVFPLESVGDGAFPPAHPHHWSAMLRR